MENTMDLASIISGLSSDPSIMGAVTELLKNMNSPSQKPVQSEFSPQNNTAPTANFSPFTASSPYHQPDHGGNGQGGNGLSPELLGSLLSALSGVGSKEQKQECNAPRNCECETQNPLGKLLGGKAEAENRIRLLNALRPYLSEERRCKLDLLLKLLKLAELGKLSGLLNSI